jgi:hypothetical protein
MGTSSQFRLHGILLPNSDWITSLTDVTPAPNAELFSAMAASDVIPSFRGGHGSTPDIQFRSPQVKTILDACGITGYDMSAGNCDLYYRQDTPYGTREAIGDSDHIRLRLVRGMMIWDEISASQDALAEISCRIIPTWDGSTAPLTPLGSQAIPAEYSNTEFFGLGPIEINDGGSFIGSLDEWRFNLTPQLNLPRSDGEPYPSFIGIETHDPVLTCTTGHFDAWTGIGAQGLALTSLNWFLRKRTFDNTGSVADGTSQHIKFTAGSGLATVEQSSLNRMNLRFGLRRNDYSAYPISVDTTAAIAVT